MKQNVQMIVQYQIKDHLINQHKEVMERITNMLPSFEAEHIQVRYIGSNKIVESFILPTESHFIALKKLRKSSSHNVFGGLDAIISGGLRGMECLALKVKL